MINVEDYPQQIEGDILLLNGSTKRSKMNRTAQKLISFRQANYSHVAFSLSLGEFIHSDTDSGVDLIFIDDLLSKYDGEWAAIRNKKMYKLVQDDERKVVKAARYFLSQEYNHKFRGIISGKRTNTSSICSSLIAYIYNNLGIDLGVNPSKALPAHFQQCLDHPDWENVTEEHRIAIDIILKIPEIKSSFLERREKAKEMQKLLSEHIKDYALINKFRKELHNLLEKIGANPGPFRETPYNKVQLEHWNTHQPSVNDE